MTLEDQLRAIKERKERVETRIKNDLLLRGVTDHRAAIHAMTGDVERLVAIVELHVGDMARVERDRAAAILAGEVTT